MKTIDEQLNIINDTKEGIANVLNSKGVEVTEDTKFADYPDKVAMLMGAGEVQAEVDRNVAEVTEQYRQDLADVSEEVNGLKTTKADKSYVDEQLAGKLDASVAAETYQPKGAYLTEHQDISGKLDASVAAETYQPKGAYLTEHQSLDAYATKEYVGQQGFLTQHQDISGKLDASVAAETYQPKGAYLTEHQDISGKLDASVAADTYQPKGNYLTEHQSLDAYATKEYVGEQGFLTQHQDISGKLDASVAAETYQPKGNYLTEHQSLTDYALKSELPLVPTNVSAFTNDAGYLTSHQDISNLLDVSTAAETYATKQYVDNKEVDLSEYPTKNDVGTYVKYPCASDNVNDFKNGTITVNKILFHYSGPNFLEAKSGNFYFIDVPFNGDIHRHLKVRYHTSEGLIGEWTDHVGNGNFASRVSCTINQDNTEINAVFKFSEPVTFINNSNSNGVIFTDIPGADFSGTCFLNEVTAKEYIAAQVASIDLSGKLDVSVAASTYQPKGTYLTEHQDISGKLDASVAAETYQPIGNYLTEHQDISGKLDASVAATTYAAKSDMVVSEEVQLDVSNALATVTRLYFDKNNTDNTVGAHYYEDVHFKVAAHPLYNNRTITYGLRYNENDNHWYTFAYNTGDGTLGNASDPLFDMTQVWDPYENGQNLYYKINGNPTMSIVQNPSTGANYRIVIEFETPTEFYVNTASDVHVDGETAVWTGLSTQTWKQYVDSKIAALEALIAGYHPANNNPE